MPVTTAPRPPSTRRFLLAAATLVVFLLPAPPALSATASKKFVLEKNRPMSLELSAAQVRVEKVLFEFPSSVLRLETAGKARITVVNGGADKARIGLALALFDDEGSLVAAGAGGNKGGQVAPGEKAEFSVFFYYVTERIPSATSFQITLETK
jgi:hypothetical protein